MLSIQDIQKVSRNSGGINKLFLVLEKDIFSFPVYSPASDYYQGNLQLKTGSQAHSIYFTSSSGQFDDVGNISHRAGDYFSHKLSFKTPHDRPVLRSTIDRLRNKDVACVYKDRNHHFKIVRNLRAKVKVSTNTKAGYNGASFDLIGKSIRPAGFWEYQVNAYITDSNPYSFEELPSGGSGGGGAGSGMAPNRLTFPEVSGWTLQLPAGLPSDINRIYVYRSGSLIPFEHGVIRSGDFLQFAWRLDQETIEIVFFT